MSQNAPHAIVELAQVTKVYKQGSVEVPALRGVDLVVAAGEFTAICGPSGSGKTTTLNLIGALDRPTSGVITIDGRNLSGLDRRALSHLRRDRIGFVFQAYNLMPVLTADEPTANVDSKTADTLLAIMESLNRERNVTFLFSTHDPRVMERARRVVRMADGRIERDEVKNA